MCFTVQIAPSHGGNTSLNLVGSAKLSPIDNGQVDKNMSGENARQELCKKLPAHDPIENDSDHLRWNIRMLTRN